VAEVQEAEEAEEAGEADADPVHPDGEDPRRCGRKARVPNRSKKTPSEIRGAFHLARIIHRDSERGGKSRVRSEGKPTGIIENRKWGVILVYHPILASEVRGSSGKRGFFRESGQTSSLPAHAKVKSEVRNREIRLIFRPVADESGGRQWYAEPLSRETRKRDAPKPAERFPAPAPPNAIVYGSGMIPITQMMKAGIFFDIAGCFVIWAGLRVLLPMVDLG